MSMSKVGADRCLVFGVMAHQMNFLDEDGLVAALRQWTERKDEDLAGLVVRSRALAPEEARSVEQLARRQIEKFGGPERVLSGLSLAPEVRRRLRALNDPELDEALLRVPESLAAVAAPGPGDPSASVAPANDPPGAVNFAAFSMRHRLSRFLNRDLLPAANVARLDLTRVGQSGAGSGDEPDDDPETRAQAPSPPPPAAAIRPPAGLDVMTPPRVAAMLDSSPEFLTEVVDRARRIDDAAGVSAPPRPTFASEPEPESEPADALDPDAMISPEIVEDVAAGRAALVSDSAAVEVEDRAVVPDESTDSPSESESEPEPIAAPEPANVAPTSETTATAEPETAPESPAIPTIPSKPGIDLPDRIRAYHEGGRRARKAPRDLHKIISEILDLCDEAARLVDATPTEPETESDASATGTPNVDRFPVTGPLFAERLGIAPDDPSFLGPEQIGGNREKIGPATDVYRLGALLYWALTGFPIGRHERGPVLDEEIRRRVLDSDYPTPAQCAGRVPAPLETVCLKALSIAADVRPPHPAALAEDLRLYLKAHPAMMVVDRGRRESRGIFGKLRERAAARARLAAQEPPAMPRAVAAPARRKRRRADWTTIGLVAVAAVALGAALGGLWYARRADRQRELAIWSEYQGARRGMDALVEAVRSDPTFQDPGLGAAKSKLLAVAREFYADFIDRDADRAATGPEIAREVSNAHLRLAELDEIAGNLESSIDSVAKARAILESILKSQPGDLESRLALASSLEQLARLQERRGDDPSAERALLGSLEIRRELALEKPNDATTLEQLARGQSRLGAFYSKTGKSREAEAVAREALKTADEVAALRPGEPALRKLQAETRARLAALAMDLGRADEARDHLEKALAIRDAVAKGLPEDVDARFQLALAHAALGRFHEDAGLAETAETSYRRALTTLAELAKSKSSRADVARELAMVQFRLGDLARRSGQDRVAEPQLAEAASGLERVRAGSPRDAEVREALARALAGLAELQLIAGRTLESDNALRRARDVLQEAGDSADDATRAALATVWRLVGLQQALLGDDRQAEDALRNALTILERTAPGSEFGASAAARRRELAAIRGQLANLLAASERFPEAESHRREAVNLLVAAVRSRPDDLAIQVEALRARIELAKLLHDMGRPDAAEPLLDESLDTLGELNAKHPTSAAVREALALTCQAVGLVRAQAGRADEAETAFLRAHQILSELSAEHPHVLEHKSRLAAVSANLGNFLSQVNKNRDAVVHLRQALDLQTALVNSNPRLYQPMLELGKIQKNVAGIYYDKGQNDVAAKFYEAAIETLASVRKAIPSSVPARIELAKAHWGRAVVLGDTRSFADSLKEWDRALEVDDGRHRVQMTLLRALTSARSGAHAEAVRAVEAVLDEGAGLQPLDYHNAAWVHAAATVAARQDPALSQAERDETAARNADRAVALVARALDAGCYDSPRTRDLLGIKDFEELRRRDDFRDLLARIRSNSAPAESAVGANRRS